MSHNVQEEEKHDYRPMNPTVVPNVGEFTFAECKTCEELGIPRRGGYLASVRAFIIGYKMWEDRNGSR